MHRSFGFATISLALLMAFSSAGALTWALPRLLGYHPPQLQQRPVQCPAGTPSIPRDRPLRIMNWNIQFFAGSYYPYWSKDFDQPLLTKEDLDRNLNQIVKVIREQEPDILQLQEVHRTHPISLHQDQLALLYARLADMLPCYSWGSYWKARWIPAKYMMGNIDMALVTMSRFRMDEASQQVLPATRKIRTLVPFYPRHSLLETRFPLQAGGVLTTINTHLDAPTLNRGKIGNQLHALFSRVTRLSEKKRLWVLSGDLNLLPPGFYQYLPENQKSHYTPQSPLIPFYRNFQGIPTLSDLHSQNRQQWLTAYDLNRDYLDLVVDYIFHPPYLQSQDSQVLHLPLDTSDHMPVLTTILLPTSHEQVSTSPEPGN